MLVKEVLVVDDNDVNVKVGAVSVQSRHYRPVTTVCAALWSALLEFHA
jgi:CheY-like chemotaxis protein